MGFTVKCADNTHYGNDNESYSVGEFGSYEEAVAKCKGIVRQCHEEAYKPGETAQALYAHYLSSGQDPYIMPTPEGQHFSTSAYAKKLAQQMCGRQLSPKYDEALQFAAELHRDQFRKGSNVPYMSHLLAVSGLVMEYDGFEDEAIAALLHDAIEDQAEKVGGKEALCNIIEERFGAEVLRIVEACTDSDTQPKPPWRKRKEDYLEHLDSGATPYALLVSSCDKLHNARSIVSDQRQLGDALFDRFTGGKEGTLWYYRALVGIYRRATVPTAVDELDLAVTEMERLAEPGPDPDPNRGITIASASGKSQ